MEFTAIHDYGWFREPFLVSPTFCTENSELKNSTKNSLSTVHRIIFSLLTLPDISIKITMQSSCERCAYCVLPAHISYVESHVPISCLFSSRFEVNLFALPKSGLWCSKRCGGPHKVLGQKFAISHPVNNFPTYSWKVQASRYRHKTAGWFLMLELVWKWNPLGLWGSRGDCVFCDPAL